MERGAESANGWEEHFIYVHYFFPLKTEKREKIICPPREFGQVLHGKIFL